MGQPAFLIVGSLPPALWGPPLVPLPPLKVLHLSCVTTAGSTFRDAQELGVANATLLLV